MITVLHISYTSEQAKEHICVEGSLVGLVHDDGTVVVQVWLSQWLSQQDAVCHVLDYCLLERERKREG